MIWARRTLLLPFVPLYASVIRFKRWLFDRGFLGQRKLGHPVISVGSLSAGGAGKTPVVLMLAERLAVRGFEVRILTRGYGRVGKLTLEVDPEGDAGEFGDEPLMLARRLPGARVFVGKDRHRAGLLAERGETVGKQVVYLLDDGFQHRKLARDVEILLITRQDLDDALLPAGNLREPLRSIERADFIVIREDEADLARALQEKLPFHLPPMLTIRRRLSLPETSAVSAQSYVFSGLARPLGFVAMLTMLGIVPKATYFFRDHHRYRESDVEQLVGAAGQVGADGFVTTEKDAVKLTSAMSDRLQTTGPLIIATLNVDLVDEEDAIDRILDVSTARSLARFESPTL